MQKEVENLKKQQCTHETPFWSSWNNFEIILNIWRTTNVDILLASYVFHEPFFDFFILRGFKFRTIFKIWFKEE